jgi:mannose-6-phosphate isomerase-like protein (cupin superfamily)
MTPVVSALRPLKHYVWGEGCDGWNLVDTPELSVKQERMPPHTAEAEHYHRVARQFFFILEGAAVFELSGGYLEKIPPGELLLMSGLRPAVRWTALSGGRVEVAAREGFEIEPGIKHRILNESEVDLVFVLCSQPSTANDRIELT